MVVGVEDEIGVLESGHRGETFFRTLQYKDNQIFRRYYLGNLLLGDNSQTGTYAQSQTQLEFGSLVFDGILEEIANCIQKQIINPIVEANYGDITLAPTISFDKFTTGDLTALFNTIKPLIDSGVVDSENPAVQDSIALLIKKETGLNYTNETEPINEEFNLPPDNEELTTNILDQLEV
jgi:phage gp29-like protein